MMYTNIVQKIIMTLPAMQASKLQMEQLLFLEDGMVNVMADTEPVKRYQVYADIF